MKFFLFTFLEVSEDLVEFLGTFGADFLEFIPEIGFSRDAPVPTNVGGLHMRHENP